MEQGRILTGNRTAQRAGARAQSAMEFLMTYGWSILIVAVVLSVLYYLGIFSSASLIGNSCTASSGYLCQNPTLDTTGLIVFDFGQFNGAPFYNVQLACTATSNTLGLPNPITAFNSISSSGVALPASNTGNTLSNGQRITISSLPCYNAAGVQLGASTIGASFSGYIWVNYTSGSGAASQATNPWHTTKAATLRTRVI